jgi:DivIVA domain-containing protein
MGKKEKATDVGFTPPAGEPAPKPKQLGPLDIQQKEFRVSRFGGYKMRDVDEFLDHVTDSMSALLAEIDRLRAGSPASGIVGSADLDDVNRQADEIIRRAREEASRIVATARAGVAPTAPAGTVDRAAVAAFLAHEREFLQSLAGLVQDHAQTVKGMAKASKDPAQQPATDLPETPAAEQPSEAVERPSEAVAEAPPRSDEPHVTEDADPAEQPEREAATAGPEPTVRIEDPEPAGVRRADEGSEQRSNDEDTSLRELFWGED